MMTDAPVEDYALPEPEDGPPPLEGGHPGADAAATSSADGDDPPPLETMDDDAAGDGDDKKEAPEGGNGEGEDDDDESPPADASPDDLLLRAMTHKEDGNSAFKSGDYASAARSYRRGTNALKNLNNGNTGDVQVKQLLITLQTNLSMVCHKQGKHRMSRDVASKAVEIDPANVKALYRRAVAHRAMGDVDAARVDLRAALKEDPNNVSVKKELISVKKILEDRKAKEKANLQKAFSKGGSSLLYSDKEELEKRREREQKEKEEADRKERERLKKEWEDECVKRMSSDPPQEAISFEDWDKQRREKEEEEEKARKKAKKAEEERKKEERRKKREAEKAAKKDLKDDDSDDDELTEKELAMLRGYKKTSDGRTTSYFNREQTEHEKKLIGCIAPKRLDESGGSTAPSPTASLASSGVGGPSAWNASGTTWEEKDTTDWCKKTLEQCLLETTAAYYSASSNDGTTYVGVTKKVKGLTGDASVAIAGGKKRYIYDFHASIEYEVADEGGDVVASGTLKLPEIHSANTTSDAVEELEIEVLAWKKAPKASEGDGGFYIVQDCVDCRKMLIDDIRKSVLRYVKMFNENF